ncbi:MAG: hypothetical protein LBJ71_04835, partial [Holosporaceae bacterium]|nr:hypothetical protein [Holosporaceae bacterium]
MSLITQTEWARRQGFSKQYVGRLINQGKIKLVDGMIDEKSANAVLQNQRDPSLPIRRNGSNSYENKNDMHDL